MPGMATDAVDHPAHYGGADNPYEAIKVIEAWDLDFCLGNAVKYVSRAGKKVPNLGDALSDEHNTLLARAAEVEDLKKARWYLDRAIRQRQEALNEAKVAVAPTAKSVEEAQVRAYPYDDGDVTVLGPQVFAATASDGSTVLNWQGENFVSQEPREPCERCGQHFGGGSGHGPGFCADRRGVSVFTERS
jgi:hypothetical protein